MNKETIEAGKSTAITSYILGIGVFIAMSMNAENKNPFASFHIRQGLGLTLTFISLGLIISNFDSLLISFPMWIFISILWFSFLSIKWIVDFTIGFFKGFREVD